MVLRVTRKRVYWYVLLVGSNGLTRMASETYDSKGNAVRAAEDLSLEINVPIEVKI